METATAKFSAPKVRYYERELYVIRETGFELKQMEVLFCDSEYFQRETRKQYGFGDDDIVIYEFFAAARKN